MTIAEAFAALDATPALALNDTQVAHNAARLRQSLTSAVKIGYEQQDQAPGYIQLEASWLESAVSAWAADAARNAQRREVARMRAQR